MAPSLDNTLKYCDLVARIWNKVRVDQETGCHLFEGARGSWGKHGTVGAGRISTHCLEGGYKSRVAHRVLWEAYNGPLPARMKVLHRCDVPNCVNINHLFLGTQQDNMTDMVMKGRHKSRTKKVSDEQIADILSRFSRGEAQADLCKEYGVSPSWMSTVVRGLRRTKLGVGV